MATKEEKQEKLARIQVGGARGRDVGKGVARIDHEVMSQLGIREGQVIEIVGKR